VFVQKERDCKICGDDMTLCVGKFHNTCVNIERESRNIHVRA